MELSERGNWLLSAAVGALIAANGAVWALTWGGIVGRISGGILAIGGLFIAVNAVRAIRNSDAVRPMEWTRAKTAFNVAAIVFLGVSLGVSLLPYL